MAKIKGVVLGQKTGGIIVLTEDGEFRSFYQAQKAKIGQEVSLLDYKELAVYAGATVFLFFLMIAVFLLLTGAK